MSDLNGLVGGVRRLVDDAFRKGEQPTIAYEEFLIEKPLGRIISLKPLAAILEEKKKRFTTSRIDRPKSDVWLAPRVHAALRLTRREAADRRIWNYLTIAAFPDYVRERFLEPEKPDVPVPLDRFFGEDSKNALARLWWAAELTRNGPDYSPTEKALRSSRFSVSWQKLDAMHHRPVALAVVDFLSSYGTSGTTNEQGEVMAKAFNLALRTLSMDALSTNPDTDAESLREWRAQPIDETKMMNELPIGPDEDKVPEKAIATVRAILDRLADSIDLSKLKATKGITNVDGEAEATGSNMSGRCEL